MHRRRFLTAGTASVAGLLLRRTLTAAAAEIGAPLVDAATSKDWLARWEESILRRTAERSFDKETGEEIGWVVSPFLDGFYYGYLTTRDPKWVALLVDWTDSWFKRAVKEPDGFLGWPKNDPAGPADLPYADSLLGEAMGLRPVVLMADVILKTPALERQWGPQARRYLDVADQVYRKWDARFAWREVKEGGLWVEPAFVIDRKSGRFTPDYERRKTDGFSFPDNKENEITQWLLAMYDVTNKPVYRARAESWLRLQKSRMKLRDDGKYFVWDYWDPAGPWDHKADGSLKHWVGVHPNGGYYWIDVGAIVAGFEHRLVFNHADIDRLISTNRDYMWNKQVQNAKFQRIDGGQPDPRWQNSPGVLWTALVPYDATLRKIFAANHDPSDWGGIGTTPWALSHRIIA